MRMACTNSLKQSQLKLTQRIFLKNNFENVPTNNKSYFNSSSVKSFKGNLYEVCSWLSSGHQKKQSLVNDDAFVPPFNL